MYIRKSAGLVLSLALLTGALIVLYHECLGKFISSFGILIHRKDASGNGYAIPTSDVIDSDDVTRGTDVIDQEYVTSSPQVLLAPMGNLLINRNDTSSSNFIRHTFMGRLGNVFFQYASIYCIAKQNRLRPLLQNIPDMNLVRDPGVLYPGAVLRAFHAQTHFREHHCCSYENTFQHLRPDQNYSILGYLQSWKYFEPCKEDILNRLTFKPSYVSQARRTVSSLRKRYADRVLVGIHIRMEDHAEEQAVNSGKRIATPAYFRKAMTYFRNGFHDVTFIAITSTSSLEWWKENVTASLNDMAILTRSHPAVDMEILSSLDHLIISVGTYGWWAAYKSKGIVVCFDDFYTPASHYSRQFLNNATDFIYPGWVRMR